MDKKVNFVLLLALVLTVISLAACTSSQVRMGYVGGQSGNQMHYTFTRFDGLENKTIQLVQGERLSLAYAAELEEGSLTFQVIAPDGSAAWERTVVADEAGTGEILSGAAGLYRISATGKDARGGFELAWEKD